MEMSFLLATLAGCATLIGALIIFITKKKSDKIILSALSFASGVMISVSLTDLVVESFKLINQSIYQIPSIIIILLGINIGFIITKLIDKLTTKKNYDNLYKLGIMSMIVIILHNLPEGIATFITTTKDTSLGMSLSLAIAMHNIPEGITIALPIYYHTKSYFKAFLYTLIAALSEPLGAFLAYLFLMPIMTNFILGFLFSIIAGIMIYISITELLPTSLKYNYKKLTIIFFLIGVLVVAINHFII